MILSLEHITKSYGAALVLEDVCAAVEDRDKIGLIGPNGAGKTTLLGIIYGDLEPDGGKIARSGKPFGFLRQNSGLSSNNSILEEMRGVFAPLLELEAQLREWEAQLAQLPPDSGEYARRSAHYAQMQSLFESRDGYRIDVKIRTVLGGMGFGGTDPQMPVDVLSGGEKTRLALCKLLLEQPALLILDEPTNHLDFRTLQWLEDYLLDYKGALLAVSHDRYFLDRLCGSIWEIEHNRLSVYTGNYSRYVVQKQERLTRQQKEYDIQRRQIADMKDFIARNIVRASTTNRAQSRQKALDKMEKVERPRPPAPPPKLRFAYKREPVKDVLHVRGLSVGIGEGAGRKKLFEDVDFDLMRGDKVALIGPNGVGKSTFLRVLLGLAVPDAGSVEWGVNTARSYFEQEEFGLDSTKSALQELWDRFPRESEHTLRTVLGQMGLSREAVRKQVGRLSGGERAKLKFAILCLNCGNVLIMDEPTNHLDLPAKEALDRALQEYSGTLLVVSHDRYLLNKFPERIAEMHPQGIRLYSGNYDAYLAQKRAQPQAEPACVRTEKREAGHRTKKQRSQDAARKLHIGELERGIERLETEIASLEQEISDPKTAKNYILLQEKCVLLEKRRREHTQHLTEWAALGEQ